MKKYIVDTNFVLRYLLADNKKQYKRSKVIFDQVRDGRVHAIFEQSVFAEVIFVLTSFYKTPKEKVVETIHFFLSYKGIEGDKDVLQHALQLYKNSNLHIVDCILAARSEMTKLPILTFDKKLENRIGQ